MIVILAACSVAPGEPLASPPRTELTPSAPTPSPTASLAPSPTADGVTSPLVAEADDLSMTVTLDRATVVPGETVTFAVTFRNDGAVPIDYSVPWCGGAASIALSVALPQAPAGKRWTGIAQVFKDYVLTEAYGPGGVPALEPVRQEVRAKPCLQDQEFEGLLDPGKSITRSLQWRAEIVPGVHALAGTVPFTVNVGYDRQNGPPSIPPDHTGPIGSWVAVYKHLEVSGTFEIVGNHQALVGPGEVIDSILEDPKFARWLAKEPKATWSNANLFLTSSRKGEGIVPAVRRGSWTCSARSGSPGTGPSPSSIRSMRPCHP